MLTRDIPYISGGKSFTGYLAAPGGGGSWPGVLVCHQGGGLTEHAKEKARMLAEEGYVAFALDLYGEVATSIDHAMGMLGGLAADKDEWRRRSLAGLDVLKAQDGVDTARLAAVGYCFGGATVLELARAAPELRCVVAFHPGMSGAVAQPESDERKIPTCKVMVCAGADDPLIGPEAYVKFAELMNAAGADWQFIFYGGAGHSFTDKSVDAFKIPHFKFHAPTDRRSWAAMKTLFDEVFESA
jgi:dienelactone hydrolase